MDEQEKQTKKEVTEETPTGQEPMMETDPSADVEEKSTGAIIGAIIIVVLLVIGGLYFLGQRMGEAPEPAEILAEPDTATETLVTQGTSDEIADIEADLNVTDLEGLDAELADIEAELGL